ncbi:MAG: energy-coupling factor ABC transporter ATP-binding protein, partial [Oscillospiraceae bacterium]
TAGLDPYGVSELLKLLTKLQNENNLTIIISTHDIDIVPLYCDYAYVLDHGKVVLSDTSETIFTKADELRRHSLRLPRIAHLMEVLSKSDHLDIDKNASTISKARKSIRELLQSE